VLKTAGLIFPLEVGNQRRTAGHLKKGKADLRYGLYQAALIASTKTGTSGIFHQE
jgi:hypothetical protein